MAEQKVLNNKPGSLGKLITRQRQTPLEAIPISTKSHGIHPLSYSHQRRKWITEQTHAQRMRRANEVTHKVSLPFFLLSITFK